MVKKGLLLSLLYGLTFTSLRAQEMNPDKLKELIVQVSDTLQNTGNTLH